MKNSVTKINVLAIFLLLNLSFIGCYSFKGISIADNMNTFDVPFVEIRTADAPVGINQDFQQKLIEKISKDSRLSLNADQPDILLQCSITRYIVEAISPTANNNVDASRLVISIKVNYIDNMNPENNWDQNFTNNEEFESGVSLLSIQNELTEVILNNIINNVFNKAFTNW